MSRFESFVDESPFLESDVLTAEEIEPRYDVRGIESPFLAAELEQNFAPLEEAEDSAPSDGVIAFDSQTLKMRVAVYVTEAARRARQVEVFLFAHGLDVCGPVLKNRPVTFITEKPFRLGQLVEASGRPVVLVVPFLDWEQMARNKLSFGYKWHKLAQPKNMNGVLAEALEKAGSPSISRLIIAGHSRAFGVFDAMASLHTDPEMQSGALGKLSHIWALDTTYTSPVENWMKWLASRSDLRMTVIYRFGTWWSEKKQKNETLPTGIHGSRFHASATKSGGRMTIIPVPMGKTGHCAIPGRYLPELLSSLSERVAPEPGEELEYVDEELYAGDTEDSELYEYEEEEAEEDDLEFAEEEMPEDNGPSAESFGAFAEEEEEKDDESGELEEFEDVEMSGEEEDSFAEEEVLESSGLTPAQLKAVQITSTFETGKRGGFYGLSGNFDGYGISFGLVNWNIGSGSLQPLLRDFASEQPARWNAIFGSDAASFLAVITPKGNAATKAQLRFAIDEMNTSTVVKGKPRWSVKEPWVTYFRKLSEDSAFQAIQVRYVRTLLDRGREFCQQYGLTSEMAYTFMFDAVSSHGMWWPTKKNRAALVQARLAALNILHGNGNVPEAEVLLAIAAVLAETSAERWRDNVRRRKEWFVTHKHPRAAELKGLEPRADVPYAASSSASSPAPKPAAVPHQSTMTEAERKKYIAAALTQAKTAGDSDDRAAIRATLAANGTDLESWFAGMVPDATFLGRPIQKSGGIAPGVHRALFEVLQRVERMLLDQHPGRTPEELGDELGVHQISGLRPPKKATGGTLPSFHCFGLAVDINHDTNPFVGNMKPKKGIARYEEFMANRSPRIIERAMWLLRGEKFNVEKPISGSVGAIWDVHHRASDTLAEYLRLDPGSARLQTLVTQAQANGDSKTLAWWKNRITTDKAMLPHWDFQNHKHPEKTGYMDLPRELVLALAAAGLLWGGQYQTGKDIMHFDLRTGPIRHR